jgi:multicomponent Na+:H+ antiporter subunit C
MTPAILYALTGVLLFCIGLRGLIAEANLLRKILAVNIMSSGVFLLLVGIAFRHPDLPPDPVPHAMVLTGIVVAVSATAFALVLVRQIFTETGATRLPEDEQL